MKITIYELLGMIKDGKAPKKIKFNNIYCYYRECKNEYVDYTNKPIIQWDYVVMNSLNDKVEILEEENKKCTVETCCIGIEELGKTLLKIKDDMKSVYENIDKVETLEEKKKIPEKLDYCEENTFSIRQTGMTKEDRRLLDSNFKEIGNKINSIIDYLKSKGDE